MGSAAIRNVLLSTIVLTATGTAIPQMQPLEMPELYYRLSTELVTPHLEWLRPCPGGTIEALVVAPRSFGYRCTLREIVELMQRLDISCTPVMTVSDVELWSPGAGTSAWDRTKGTYKEEVSKSLREALGGRYDLVILGRAPVGKFPEDAVERLQEIVSKGAGLVWVYPDTKLPLYADLARSRTDAGRTFITEGTPFDMLPGLVGGKADEKNLASAFSLHEYGRGRVAILRYRAGQVLSPIASDEPDLDYEYYQSFLIKVILWATRREPDVWFAGFPASLRWDMDKAGAPPALSFALARAGKRCKVRLTLTIRSRDELSSLPEQPVVSFLRDAQFLRPVHTSQIDLSVGEGKNEVRLSLPRLPCGSYFAEVAVVRNGRCVNWAVAGLEVTSGLTISEVVCEPPMIDLSAPQAAPPELKTTVRFSQPLPEEAVLGIALVDTRGRILLTGEVPCGKAEEKAETRLRLPQPASCVVRVRAELRIRDEVRSIAVGSFTTVRRKRDDFVFGVWQYGDPRDNLGRMVVRLLADYGVEAGLGAVKGCTKIADIRPLPLLPRTFGWGAGSKVGDDHILRPCRNRPEEREKFRKTIQPIVKDCAAYDPLAYSLPDDDTGHLEGPADACWCDICVAGFRRYLQDQYGQVEELNREWGTNYASFEQAMPITRAEAAATGRYPALIDLWRFNYAKHANFLDFLRTVVQEADPSARFGSTCMAWYSFWNGFDWEAMMKSFSFCAPYAPTEQPFYVKYARSFRKPGSLLGMTYGGYNSGYSGFADRPQIIDEDFHRVVAWRMLFDQHNSCWWYSVAPGQSESGISPWLDPYPCFRLNAEQIEEIKSGIGQLILGAKLDNDGIAVHYSIPSLVFAELSPNSPPYDQPWTRKALIYLLGGLGFQYDFLPTGQVLAGKLKDYRVLVLPVSEAVGVAEAERIREFVEGGGLVIADVRPGIADDHGRLWACPRMQELFGLKWDEPLGKIEVYQGNLAGEYRGLRFCTPVRKLLIDRSVVLNGARAACTVEGKPLVTCREIGKGAAVCLNATFVASELQDVLRVVLAAHGIRPLIARKTRADTLPNLWLYGLEFNRFSDGEAQYIGITKEEMKGDRGSVPVVISLPTAGHLYEPRTGRYLGWRDRWETSLRPTDARLWSLLPYRVRGLELRASATRVKRGGSLTVEATVKSDGPKPGRHVLHFRAIGPSGQEAKYLASNVDVPDGRARATIEFALNEPTGLWQIHVSDAATKVLSAIEIEVE